MKERSTVFAGCDVGDKTSELCMLDTTGAVLERRSVRTTVAALTKALARYPGSMVAIEVGTHSRWIHQALTKAGHHVIVANPRQVQLIWKRRNKSDRADALLLARLARVDVSLLMPVHHRSNAAQVDLASIRARDTLVEMRTKLVNHIRGTLKAFGARAASCSAEAFSERVVEDIPSELLPALAPVLSVLKELKTQIASHDRQIEQLATSCPTTIRLSTVYGVGRITALTFRLTIEDPSRFKKSRVVPAFLGLTPAKDQSGESRPPDIAPENADQ